MFIIIAGTRNREYFGEFETEEKARTWAQEHLKDGTLCKIVYLNHLENVNVVKQNERTKSTIRPCVGGYSWVLLGETSPLAHGKEKSIGECAKRIEEAILAFRQTEALT